MKAAKRGEGATLALADLLLPAGVRGRLNSTYEDDCLPLAVVRIPAKGSTWSPNRLRQ
jgi:hypothetical protein